MRWLQIIRGMRNIKKEIETTEDKIQTGEISMNWKDFYDKHKAKIWSIAWVGITYFGKSYVDQALVNIPAFQDVQNKIVVIETDVKSLKLDVDEIKKVLTPPN